MRVGLNYTNNKSSLEILATTHSTYIFRPDTLYSTEAPTYLKYEKGRKGNLPNNGLDPSLSSHHKEFRSGTSSVQFCDISVRIL